MNKVLEHAAGDMTVIVQAGISLEALQRELAWRNQWLPVDPPVIARDGRAPGQRTIGGLIASNSLGPLRFGCGDWRLLIMGMRWVDAAGRIIKAGGRTVKNVAGYASHRMMIGSFGSLGAIAEVTLRTFAKPADERCVLFFCPGAAAAEELVAEILVSQAAPAYVQFVGGETFRKNPLELPAPAGGTADAGESGIVVAAGFLGEETACAAQVEVIRKLEAAKKAESLAQTAAQAGRLRLWMTSEPALSDARGPQGATGEAPALGAGFRIHGRSSEAAAMVGALEAAARKAGQKVWVVGEAASGVVRGTMEGTLAAEAIAAIAKRAGARLLWTQGAANQAAPGELVGLIKTSLDPQGVFGGAPGCPKNEQ